MSGENTSKPHLLRHIVVATDDLEAASAELQSLLGMPEGFRHDMTEILGFRNEMTMIGDMMFELVQPMTPDHRLHKWLEENGGSGGYMLVFQTFDADAFRARVAQEKLRLTRDMLFRGQDLIQFDPKRFGTHIETYRYSLPNGWWGDPVGRGYKQSPRVEGVVACDVRVKAPADEIAQQMGRIFQQPVDGTNVAFGEKTVRFFDADSETPGLFAVTCKATDPALVGQSHSVGGLVFNCV